MQYDPFICWLNHLLFWHWSVQVLSTHIVLGESYKVFNKKIDKFIETAQGRHGLFLFENFLSCKFLMPFDKKEEVFEWFCTYLLTVLPVSLDKVRDADLFNLRDDVLGEISHLQYLLQLR